MLYTWTDFQMQDSKKRYKPASEAYKALKERQKASREAKAKIKDLVTEEMFEKKEIVAEFEFYKDEANKVWANKIVSYGIYQGIGIGTQIIKTANEKFGKIYFSNATQSEKAMFSKDKANDFRYFSDALKFEDSNIGLFVSSLIKKGIIKSDQIQNPYTI